MPVGPEDYRAVFRRLPSGIAVVTAVTDGVSHAMTVNSFVSVSLDPPLVAVMVSRRARLHGPLLAAGGFAVSVLAHDQHELAQRFATAGRDLATQFDDVVTTAAPRTRGLLIGGSVAWVDCPIWAVYDGGDHSIVVGEVAAAGVDPDAVALVRRDGHYDGLPGTR